MYTYLSLSLNILDAEESEEATHYFGAYVKGRWTVIANLYRKCFEQSDYEIELHVLLTRQFQWWHCKIRQYWFSKIKIMKFFNKFHFGKAICKVYFKNLQTFIFYNLKHSNIFFGHYNNDSVVFNNLTSLSYLKVVNRICNPVTIIIVIKLQQKMQ